MATRSIGWIVGLGLIGSAVSANALADGGVLDLYNPLGIYVGAGLGRSTLNETQISEYDAFFNHLDANPLGWNAEVGIRPLPFLGAEVQYIDFGNAHLGAGPPYYVSGYSDQYLGGETHDRAAALFAVGYLPLPIPWVEPFAKLGFAQIWQHESYSGIDNSFIVNGGSLGQFSGSQTNHPSGAAYGGGLQFHFQQLGVRAEFERISGTRSFNGWDNPQLLSVGVNWTF